MQTKEIPSKKIGKKVNHKPKCFKNIPNVKLISITREDTTSKGSYTIPGTTRIPFNATKTLPNSLESEKLTYRRDTLVKHMHNSV